MFEIHEQLFIAGLEEPRESDQLVLELPEGVGISALVGADVSVE
jgi:hypothetical protein